MYVVAGKLLGGASVLILNLYLVQLLPPAMYGAYIFCVTALLLMDGMVCSAIDISVLRAVTDRHSEQQTVLTQEEAAGLVLKGITIAILLIVIALFGEQLGQLAFHQSDARPLLLGTVLSTGAQFLFRSLQVHYQAQLRFKIFGFAEMAHTIVRVVLIVASVAAGIRDITWFVCCYAISPLLVIVVLSWREEHSNVTLQAFKWTYVVRQMAIARDAVATLGVGGLVSRLDIFVLAFTRSSAELGMYGAAQSIAIIPEILSAYIAPALTPRIMPLCREGKFYDFYKRFYLYAYAAVFVGTAVALLSAGPVISRLLPAAYRQSVELVQVLAPGYIATFLLFPLTLNFMLFFAPRTFLWYDLSTAPVLAAAYYWGSIHHGMYGVALVCLFARVLKVVIMQTLGTRLAYKVGRAGGITDQSSGGLHSATVPSTS